jgi:DNA-binding NtrC family response regulator
MSQGTTCVWFCSADVGLAQAMARVLGSSFELRHSEEFNVGDARGREGWCDVAMLDLRPAGNGADLDAQLGWVDEINQGDLPPPIVAILGEGDSGLKVMERGVYDTLSTPPNIVELRLILQRAHKFYRAQKKLHRLRSQEPSLEGLYDLIGSSESMQKVFCLARRIAPCDVNVLVTGETGTGKELLARAIHCMSAREARPFVAFSCANFPETLIEDELFGHEQGAFTGALKSRQGRLESADEGTLFLDEVGDLGLSLQPKLLRVLQEHTFERLGSNRLVSVNLRLVCATNRKLDEMVRQGKFREDLYYRLNVVQIHLPPLRERPDDIPLLVHHFLKRFAMQFKKKARRFSRAALLALEEYPWPGNVRELENAVQRAVALADGQTIDLRHLPTTTRNGLERLHVANSYDEEVRRFKRRLILRALNEHGWSKTQTARALGLSRAYLHRLIDDLEIREERSAGSPPDEPALLAG